MPLPYVHECGSRDRIDPILRGQWGHRDEAALRPGSMKPGILVSPRVDEVDLTLTGGLNSFTLRGSAATIRAQLTDAIAVLDQVQADGITRYKIKEI